MNDDKSLYKALKSINDYGVVYVINIPYDKLGKEGMEELITHTCYSPAYIPLYGLGSDFLLGAEKNETQKSCPQCFCNIPQAIEPHQDFAYFEDVPGLFFNACMRKDEGIKGGINGAMDVFNIAKLFKIE